MSKATVQPIESVAALVDELGALNVKLKAVAPALARSEAIKARLKELHAHLAPDQSATLKGKLYESTISACTDRATIDLDGALKVIGPTNFWPLFKQPPTTEITKLLPLPTHATLISRGATGPRNITTQELPKKAPAKRKAA